MTEDGDPVNEGTVEQSDISNEQTIESQADTTEQPMENSDLTNDQSTEQTTVKEPVTQEIPETEEVVRGPGDVRRRPEAANWTQLDAMLAAADECEGGWMQVIS